MGKIVTFYSYKGGTGRTMALANVAWVLASSGARVLVVDWDLEAPGLHRYFRPFLADQDLTRLESQGVIDLMADFVGRLATPGDPGAPRGPDWFHEHADISKWSKLLLWPSGQDARTDAGGTIEFVPAGRQGPQYASRVNSFDWAGFYDKSNGGAFVDAMRRSMGQYDWVLIDSRTGVSDTSGLCTVQLPDILVVCFTLNYQSIEGASAVARSAQESRKAGQLRILPLPTRLDGNEEKLLKAMMAYARRTFSPLMPRGLDLDRYWTEMGVPYFSRYAYSEKLAPFEEQVNVSTSTLPAMERLTAYITEHSITRLKALPEAPRAETLAEFEQLPDALESSQRGIPTATGPAPPSALRRVFDLVFSRTARESGANPKWLTPVTVLALAAFFGYQALIDKTSSPGSVIPELVAEARKELAAGGRERAALLIAEAAGRLDPATVVGPVGDPARQVYEAFLALQPLQLQKGRPASVPMYPRTVLLSPDGRWVAGTGLQQETLLFRFPPQASSAESAPRGYSAAAFSPDSRYFATGGRNGSLTVYDVASGRQVWRWENKDPDSAWVNAVAFSPNGNLVAAGTDTGQVVIARVEAWTELKTFPPVQVRGVQGQAVLALAFSPDSVYLAVGGANSIVRWLTYQQEAPVEILGPHRGAVRTIAFLPAGPDTAPSAGGPSRQQSAPVRNPRRVATASGDGFVYLWTQTAGVPLKVDIPAGSDAYAVAFSRDGRLLATGGNETLLWRVSDLSPGREPTAVAKFGVSGVRSLKFSGDGKWLVTGSTDRTVRLWDVAAGRELQSATFNGQVDSVTISPDDKYVVAAASDGIYALLVQIPGQESKFPAGEVQALACSQTRETTLSAEQWKQFFRSEPIRFTCGKGSDGVQRTRQ